MRKSSFIENKDAVWMKGNLHSHSTFSDGSWTPEEMKEQYKQHGYDFLVISDHDVYTDTRHLSDEEFTMVQGYEQWGNTGDKDLDTHVHYLWAGELEGIKDGQRMTLKERTGKCCTEWSYEMRRRGAYVMLNHPHWNYLVSTDIAEENPYHAVEIINYASEWLENLGDSTVFWTELLHKGYKLWGGGGDDNHNGRTPLDNVDNIYCDSFGGWTVVKAADRSDKAIMDAMFAGSFYTSTGPSIYEFYVEDGYVHVKCSPCVRIYINGEFRQYQRKLGNHITEAVFKLKGTEKFIRLEVMDHSGRSAWSNPIWLDEE